MIYLIDDDQYVRRGFGLLFRSAGLEFSGYDDVEDFIKSYTPSPKDILILDLHLPGMTGADLLNKFIREGVKLPMIVITAYDEPSSYEIAMKYGALAFIRKPFDSNYILEIINNHLN